LQDLIWGRGVEDEDRIALDYIAYPSIFLSAMVRWIDVTVRDVYPRGVRRGWRQLGVWWKHGAEPDSFHRQAALEFTLAFVLELIKTLRLGDGLDPEVYELRRHGHPQ
jgi:hypothetical protein